MSNNALGKFLCSFGAAFVILYGFTMLVVAPIVHWLFPFTAP